MAFHFGFSADAGSDDDGEEFAPSQHDVMPSTADAPGVLAALHKLEDLVGRSILHLFSTLTQCVNSFKEASSEDYSAIYISSQHTLLTNSV